MEKKTNMEKKKKILIAAVAATVVVVAAVVVFILLGNGSDKAGKIYVQNVKELMSGTFQNRYSGVVETQKSEKFSFDTSRQLEEVYVTEGSKVKAGDKLFSYNTEKLNLEIEELQIQIEKSNSTISNNNEQISQLYQLMESADSSEKLGYSAQIQQLQADNAQAEYNIKTNQANINSKKNAISKSTIYSSMNGTVQQIADIDTIMNGDDFGGNNSGNPEGGNTFITVIADGNMRIKGKIGEQNVLNIYTGEKVIVRSRVDESITWKGTIASINTQSTASEDEMFYTGAAEGSAKYEFYVNPDNTEGLMLGQHVTIEADLGQEDTRDGIWLNSGWICSDENGDNYVWVAKSKGAKLEKRKVVLGRYDENLGEYEIQSGLKEEEFIAWPSSECKPGAATTTVYAKPSSDGLDEGNMGGGSDAPVMNDDMPMPAANEIY
ncbi:MAG: efflux RND transporter periplasmic adaptor subunit [Lachnospiraceae bacterium]|nr:efflux RND transporter periplasmic adaptor subunit [Lachnospiraceae bacterium]